MSLTNYTTDPWTIELTDSEIAGTLVQPLSVEGDGDNRVHVFSLRAVEQLAFHLMDIVHVAYRRSPRDHRDLADFSDEERRLYYPFAFMLACLDGNAFRGGANDFVFQYIPDAERLILDNSGTLEEVREMLKRACGG